MDRQSNDSFAWDPATPEFWKAYAGRKRGGSMEKRALDSHWWDQAADTYDDLEKCADYRHQVETVLDILRERNALSPSHSVIDVACGTGTYAVRMAPCCREVVCVDISDRMLARLREKKRKQGLENITIIHEDWRRYSSGRTFDLVFVSMTPLLRSISSLDRLLESTKRFLAIVSWAGVRQNVLLNSLFAELMGTKPHHGRLDITVPFNYLYAKGAAPDLVFFNGCWERRRTVEKQTESLLWQLERERPLKEEEKKYVRERVEALAKDGIVEVRTRVRTCFMLADLEAGNFPC